MSPSGVVFYGTRYFTIEQQTLPAAWLETTTQTNTITTAATYTTPIETYTSVYGDDIEEDVNHLLIIPQQIVNIINTLTYWLGQYLSLRYVTEYVTFCMICGLITWCIDKLGDNMLGYITSLYDVIANFVIMIYGFLLTVLAYLVKC